MRNLLLSALLVLVAPAAALASPPAKPAAASTMKVGVIDFEKVFNDTAASKIDRGALVKLMNDKQTAVDQRKAKLEADRQALQAKASSMDLVARARREAELDVEQASLRKLFMEAQAEVEARERELSHQVVADAKALAPEVGRAHGVSVILGAAEALIWVAPEVVQVDLTAEIARALDLKRAAAQSR